MELCIDAKSVLNDQRTVNHSGYTTRLQCDMLPILDITHAEYCCGEDNLTKNQPTHGRMASDVINDKFLCAL